MDNQENFSYTYSAVQQQEVERIRNSYIHKEESKLDRLRTLHNSATRAAQSWAIFLGVIGALVMGMGMSIVMTEVGLLLGVYAPVIGIAIGLVGMVLVILAYPTYSLVLKKRRAKIAPEILRLSEELLK